MSNKPIYVTQPSLAPLEEYTALLEDVWASGILTHNGSMVRRLENEICQWLGLKHFAAVSNGTIAIQMAIKALELKGEIITTPFTWVATLSAIKWEGCTPVFCDIEPDTFNIDPAKIESSITDKTVAIMPVHVFGNPCDVEAIEAIAAKHNLKVIYDAAHAIGSTYKGRSLLEYGDVSATSLHATKLLNTAEGGGCITTDPVLHEKLERIRFFGHNQAKEIVEDGFNGKMTEVHAALGLANLKYGDKVLVDRKRKYQMYLDGLSACEGLTFQNLKLGEPNYSYLPVLFDSEERLLKAEAALKKMQVYPRRYFYPSVNTLEHIVDYVPMSVSEDIASRILCLPLYWKLEVDCIDVIIQTIKTHAS
ncbi:MAG: DegT/DnrJ/EryC1/StrS family aminotransferase [Lentimonas sp.]